MTGRTHGYRGQIVDGRFELLERLGAGGMGTVWRARDSALHREVALKEVRPPAAEPGELPEGEGGEPSGSARARRERVLREARALARLSHPHVVTIYQIADEGPYPWLVMELVRGPSLEQRLAEGPLAPHEAARVGREVLAALRTSHAAGIQHRDVKPGNVLLREDGSAVLTDFGIAALQGSTSVTATGEFLGSPEYIAPERIRGIDDDPSSDLWSLALTLYVCTEGHNPMRRANTLATLAAVLDDPVPPPVRSGALGPVLESVLVRDSGARPGAEQLAELLADVAEGRAPVPHLPTQPAMAVQAPVQAHPATLAGSQPLQPLTGSQALQAGPATGGYGQPPGAFGTPPAPHQPNDGRKRRRRMVLTVVGAVVAAALLITGGTYLAKGNGGPDNAADGGRTSGNEPKQPTKGNPGGHRPVPNNAWVAQLGSIAKSRGIKARDDMAAELNRENDDVRWVDGDRFASLKPGYWTFYSSGPSDGFPNGHAAAKWCATKDLSDGGQCFGRYVSHAAADRNFICTPSKGQGQGQVRGTGRCER
ncbi:serine/threonine-protein kinase [Streptomyces sp. NBC_01187]|uniref:serine/threonine-protein kinase n=1 Tax=Streptomyces sp. NBC_01187 TaxID=2903766 RepID=UPI00386CF108|nr:serine/threonine protein kinase [Streptomyces sp. NBC_01187]